MLITKKTEVIWNAKNKKHYVDLGYKFTKMNDKFLVKVEDLTKGSCALIKLKCDYCGSEYTVKYYTYNKRNNKLTDCCGSPKCTGVKAIESLELKYGVSNCRQIPKINDKAKKTCIEKYGVKNPFASEIIKDKIKETNLKKYGFENPSKNKHIASKMSKSMQRFYIEHPECKKIGKESPFWKGGVKHSRVERATHEYSQWRKDVFYRDNHTCQKCFKRGGITLNAHHIKNWKDNIEIRYEINNGITLCEDCHKKFHSKYGIKNNTKEQLNKFLNLDEKIC